VRNKFVTQPPSPLKGEFWSITQDYSGAFSLLFCAFTLKQSKFLEKSCFNATLDVLINFLSSKSYTNQEVKNSP